MSPIPPPVTVLALLEALSAAPRVQRVELSIRPHVWSVPAVVVRVTMSTGTVDVTGWDVPEALHGALSEVDRVNAAAEEVVS